MCVEDARLSFSSHSSSRWKELIHILVPEATEAFVSYNFYFPHFSSVQFILISSCWCLWGNSLGRQELMHWTDQFREILSQVYTEYFTLKCNKLFSYQVSNLLYTSFLELLCKFWAYYYNPSIVVYSLHLCFLEKRKKWSSLALLKKSILLYKSTIDLCILILLDSCMVVNCSR